jgi:hypothetical protein
MEDCDQKPVARAQAVDQRLVEFFTDGDGERLGWWIIEAQTDDEGDVAQIPVGVDERCRPAGFTALALLRIALARAEDEARRRALPASEALVEALRLAVASELVRRAGLPEDDEVVFANEGAATPYSGAGIGISLAQLLLILKQLFHDLAAAELDDNATGTVLGFVGQAYAHETDRFIALRDEAEQEE